MVAKYLLEVIWFKLSVLNDVYGEELENATQCPRKL